MTRDLGSLGTEVAQAVAGALRLRLVHDEILEAVAGRMRMCSKLIRRFMEGKPWSLDESLIDESRLAACITEQLDHYAGSGDVVISGWGAPYLLRDLSHTLCIRVTAPIETRVKRLMSSTDGADVAALRNEVALADARYARTMYRLFGATDLNDPEMYDLVLDTGQLSIEECVGRVAQLVGPTRPRDGGSMRSKGADIFQEPFGPASLARASRLALWSV
jgi:cytidylate kinase